MSFLKVEQNGKQVDLVPVNDNLKLCDGCYGLIEFCETAWKLKEEDSVDLVREWTTELLRQINEGATLASHDIFTGVIVDE